MSGRYFTPALFAFFGALEANNDRAWFAEHKSEYEAAVRDPFLRFIADPLPPPPAPLFLRP